MLFGRVAQDLKEGTRRFPARCLLIADPSHGTGGDEVCACLQLGFWCYRRFATVAASQACARPRGHYGQGHAENHDWYKELKQPSTGYSCCNGRCNSIEGDCRPTRAYINDDGMWYALLDGRWVPVPPRVVLKQLAPDGRAHICASKSGMIYCFLGGSPKSSADLSAS